MDLPGRQHFKPVISSSRITGKPVLPATGTGISKMNGARIARVPGSEQPCRLLLIIVIFLVRFSSQQDTFYFDPSPVSQDVTEGEELRLRCDVSNRHLITFYWTLNAKPLTNTSRRFQDGSDLRILRVDRTLDTVGGFRCVAVNISTGIAARSAEARLNVIWIDDTASVALKQPTETSSIAENAEVIIKCQTEGNPEPTVEWFNNRIKLFANDRLRFLKNRQLRISSVKSSDNGVYTCRARNLAASQLDSIDSFILNVPGNASPRLNTESFISGVIAKRGSSAILHCQFYNVPGSAGSGKGDLPRPGLWFIDDRRITQSNKYDVMGNGSLVVRDVTMSDVGSYRCVSPSSDIKVAEQTFTAQLLLAYLNNFKDASFEPRLSSQPFVIPIGSKLEIRCLVPKGLPTPTLRWEYEGPDAVRVLNDNGRVRASADGILTVTDALDVDRGNYSCVVENVADVRRRTFALALSLPPRIVRPPSVQTVEEGEAATFECRYIGTLFPITVVSWKKDNELIDAVGSTKYSLNQAGGTLTISSVALQDGGSYTCMVTTQGYAPIFSQPGQLYVAKRLQFRPAPTNTHLQLGSNSTLRCHADGRNVPSVTWSRFGGRGLPSHVMQGTSVGATAGEGVLTLYGVKQSDTGLYVCTATNDQGTINATIRVDVVAKPVLRIRPTNSTVYEGEPVMLDCTAVGDPIPAVQWDKNHDTGSFDLHRFQMLNNGSLYISVAYIEDGGRYGCTAGNPGGFDRAEIYLNVIVNKYGQCEPQYENQKLMQGRIGIIQRDTSPSSSSTHKGDDDWAGELGGHTGSSGSARGGGSHVRLPTHVSSLVNGKPVTSSYRQQQLQQQHQHQSPSRFASSGSFRGNGYGGPSNGSSQLSNGISHIYNGLLQVSNPNIFPAPPPPPLPMRPGVQQLSNPSTQLLPPPPSSPPSHGALHGSRTAFGVPVSSATAHPSSAANVINSLQRRQGKVQSTFPRHQLQVLGLLGKSHYGDVVLARFQTSNMDGPGVNCLVAVKLLVLPASLQQQQEFQREAEMFGRANHVCVTRLLGVCCSVQPSILVTEHGELGDLKKFLCSKPASVSLTVAQRLNIVHQVTCGMQHLSHASLVHRDLAARNLLLSPTGDVKISCPALCRDIYAEDYYPFNDRLVPLRWMPPEAILEDRYTSASDSWSFAVFLFELFTPGCPLPYADRTNEQLLLGLAATAEGGTGMLQRPVACPDELWRVVQRCLRMRSEDRPTFDDLELISGDMVADSSL